MHCAAVPEVDVLVRHKEFFQRFVYQYLVQTPAVPGRWHLGFHVQGACALVSSQPQTLSAPLVVAGTPSKPHPPHGASRWTWHVHTTVPYSFRKLAVARQCLPLRCVSSCTCRRSTPQTVVALCPWIFPLVHLDASRLGLFLDALDARPSPWIDITVGPAKGLILAFYSSQYWTLPCRIFSRQPSQVEVAVDSPGKTAPGRRFSHPKYLSRTVYLSAPLLLQPDPWGSTAR